MSAALDYVMNDLYDLQTNSLVASLNRVVSGTGTNVC